MYEAVDKKTEQERTGYPGQSNVNMYRRNPLEPGQRLVRDYLAPVAAPVQKMAVGEVIQREISYEEFSGILKEILKRHIESAEPDEKDPARKNLWLEIKEKFQTEKNLWILMAKMVATNPSGVSYPKEDGGDTEVYNAQFRPEYVYHLYVSGNWISPIVINEFSRLDKPIAQTLNDIYYWITQEGANTVTKIDLTDSDVHTRGVGVCIVTCDERKFVVKPENRSFEKAVYGKEEDSLANQFNQYLAGGILGDDFRDSRIGTLDIQVSDGNKYGSKAEFLEHQQFSEIQREKRIDMKSVESMIAFASLLGIADLHEENAVYTPTGGAGEYQMNLIDAEVGMKYHLKEEGAEPGFDQLYTSVVSSEMRTPGHPSLDAEKINKESLQSYDKKLMQEFIDKMKARLKGMSSRLVVVETGKLFVSRTLFLSGKKWQENYVKDLKSALQQYAQSGLKVEMAEKNIMIAAATCDFENGKIPFFTLEFGTGKVFHESVDGHVMIAEYRGEDGEGFLNHMIRNRVNVLRLFPLRRTKSVPSLGHITNPAPPSSSPAPAGESRRASTI